MNIFITANNTECGKTYTTLKLIKALSNKGYKVGVFKPIETGVVDDKPLDGIKLLKASKNKDISLDDVVPIRLELPASPIVAGEVDFKKIDKAYQKLKKEFKDESFLFNVRLLV